MNNYSLEMEHVTKIFPGTTALKDFSARFEGGKVHTLIGKNGSGKSTLVKICSAAIQPTNGSIKINNKRVNLRTPAEAFSNGIAMVYQELSLIPELTVAENIFLGRLSKKKGIKRISIDWNETYNKAQKILESIDEDISPKVKVRSLSIGQQQVVEIAKAMSFNPSVLIFDEPTSALARNETKNLFSVIKKLKDKGVVIIYITHRLHELYKIADTVTVLRDGEYIGTIGIEKATPQIIVDMMFGEIVQRQRPAGLSIDKNIVLEVKNLSRKPFFQDVNLSLYKGEILGIAGMLGSGRTELLRSIFGADPYDIGGEIIINGKLIKNPNPMVMKNIGIGMTPENRKQEGIIQALSIHSNLCLASLRLIAPNGITSLKKEKQYVNKQINILEIKLTDSENNISSLSGGNQQKVVIGNWLNSNPKILLFDEPSRGIDVYAKQQIFQIIWDLSKDGISSIFVSSELEELIEVCHRILIMKHGRITSQVADQSIKIEELYSLCMEDIKK